MKLRQVRIIETIGRADKHQKSINDFLLEIQLEKATIFSVQSSSHDRPGTGGATSFVTVIDFSKETAVEVKQEQPVQEKTQAENTTETDQPEKRIYSASAENGDLSALGIKTLKTPSSK